MQNQIGQQVVDLSGILAAYEAQEGEVQHIIGKTGMGKTYEATRRARLFLYSGYTVYTTWRLNIPEYYDEREHFWPCLRNLILFRKNFVRFDFKENYKFVDLRTFDDKEGIFDTEKFARFLASLTDCIFFLDEGQDTFSSHKRAGEIARQSITRTRHMHKTLIIISQRAQAVDVNARGNVTFFYKCEKTWFPFLGSYFKVYRTEDIDEVNSNPLWVRHDSQGREIWKAPVYHSGFGKKVIYDAYDSWYMRQQMVRSQDIKIDAFEVGGFDKIRLLVRTLFRRTPQPPPEAAAVSEQQPQSEAIEPVKEVIHRSEEVIHRSKTPLHEALPIHARVVEYVPGTLDLRKIQVRT